MNGPGTNSLSQLKVLVVCVLNATFSAGHDAIIVKLPQHVAHKVASIVSAMAGISPSLVHLSATRLTTTNN